MRGGVQLDGHSGGAGRVCDGPHSRSNPRAVVAFILAAGYGTRLRPLTYETPKALVRVNGVTMLELVARRCIEAGARRLVVNVSYLAELVAGYLEERGGFGVPFAVSEEPGEPLETGGGIKRAAAHLPPGESVLVHNVDVLTNIDLRGLVAAHDATRPSAFVTLAGAPAESDRYLVFDEVGLLGYALAGEERLMREAHGELRRVDFCGVQVLSPEMVQRILAEPNDRFSIMDLYLRLARERARIWPYALDHHRCHDVGTPDRLAQAESFLVQIIPREVHVRPPRE
jgi:N-acetyl-alpha-D-muramate 1-phosphate uridylyltransferase